MSAAAIPCPRMAATTRRISVAASVCASPTVGWTVATPTATEAVSGVAVTEPRPLTETVAGASAGADLAARPVSGCRPTFVPPFASVRAAPLASAARHALLSALRLMLPLAHDPPPHPGIDGETPRRGALQAWRPPT